MNDEDFKSRLSQDRDFLVQTYKKLGLPVPNNLNIMELDQAAVVHDLVILIYDLFIYIKVESELREFMSEKVQDFIREYKEEIKHHEHEVELMEEYHQEELKHEHEHLEFIMHELEQIYHLYHDDDLLHHKHDHKQQSQADDSVDMQHKINKHDPIIYQAKNKQQNSIDFLHYKQNMKKYEPLFKLLDTSKNKSDFLHKLRNSDILKHHTLAELKEFARHAIHILAKDNLKPNISP